MSHKPCQSRKRRYRQHRIKCNECQSEINTDYRDIHARNVHNGKKIKFSPVVEPSQYQLHSFITSASTSTDTSGPSTVTKIFLPVSDVSKNTVQDNDTPVTPCASFPGKFIEIHSRPSVVEAVTDTKTRADESKLSNANIDQVQARQPDALVIATDDVIDESSILDEKMAVPHAETGMVSGYPDSNYSKSKSDIAERSPVFNISTSTSSTVTSTGTSTTALTVTSTASSRTPSQPLLSHYPTRMFGNESFTRTFNTNWYQKYPWISYEVQEDQCVCFSCREFENDDSFVFNNWKKPEKLSKHGKSRKHITSMTKWAKKNTSVLKQLDSAHKQLVLSNRKYLQVIIECLMFTAQQNVAIRGHEEDRKNIWEVSDINRRKFPGDALF